MHLAEPLMSRKPLHVLPFPASTVSAFWVSWVCWCSRVLSNHGRRRVVKGVPKSTYGYVDMTLRFGMVIEIYENGRSSMVALHCGASASLCSTVGLGSIRLTHRCHATLPHDW